MSDSIRMRFLFKGRVQGVGFRYRATKYALALGLTGWVKNTSDGSVVMEVQGKKEVINQLLKKIHSSQYIRIDKMESSEIALFTDEGFRVIYY